MIGLIVLLVMAGGAAGLYLFILMLRILRELLVLLRRLNKDVRK